MSEQKKKPSLMKIGLILYPFTMGAVAVNLFMVTLAWQRIGLPAFSPSFTVLISLVLCLPVNWLAARWVRRLLDEAADD